MKLKRKRFFVILTAFFLASGLFSCKDGDLTQGRRDSIGQIDDVVFVVSNQLWNSSLKDTLLYYFESPFLLLPQPEPIFRVKQFSMTKLIERPVRKKFATILMLADMSDTDAKETKTALKDLGQERVDKLLSGPDAGFATSKGKWADDQLIIYLLANSAEDLERSVVRNFAKIAAKVRQNDQPRVHKRVFFAGRNKNAEKMILDTFGVTLKIPSSYVTSAVRDRNLIWIRQETPKVSSSIIVAKINYRNENQVTADSLHFYFNAVGKKYISSQADSSYFVINDHDLPLIKSKVNLNGKYAVENRGIWELENDFMGGPFVSYLLQNPQKPDELLLLAGFVYAPQKEKKKFMQNIEAILRTVR